MVLFFSTCFVSDVLLVTLYMLSHLILVAAFSSRCCYLYLQIRELNLRDTKQLSQGHTVSSKHWSLALHPSTTGYFNAIKPWRVSGIILTFGLLGQMSPNVL